MCTMVAGLAMMAASTAMSAVSSIQQGKQQAKQANYQAKVAAQNAMTADQNAKQVEEIGRAEEQRARIAAAQKTGAMRAQASASGFDMGSESFVDDFASSDVMGDYDARAVRNQYQTQANAYHTQAGNFASDVGMYNSASKNAMTNAGMAAAGSIIGGASKMTEMMRVGGEDATAKAATTKVATTKVATTKTKAGGF